MRTYRLFFIFAFIFATHLSAQKNVFPIVTKHDKVIIVYDSKAPQPDSIAANLLAADIERITDYKPTIVTELSKAKGNIIVIGSIHSTLIQKLEGSASSFYKQLFGKWECFGLQVIEKPLAGISKAFVIAGSDARGTAYGVFTLSEKLGVSPWYWWADVPVKKQNELIVSQNTYISSPPSVKYRGIFINDEDWGLRPWAANTFEPEKKNIGPKTYAKVFELLLRLKANLLWPAMHPGTEPFYNDPENAKTATAYAIVIGSSHAEPMLRNNVGEWDEKTMGAFNYITNKEKVDQYWEERVQQSKGNEVVYTLGMRGVHDSGIEGVKDPKEAVPLVERIINDQRELLKKDISKQVDAVPQVFTAYKEVLDIYDNGLKLPDDVTLVWPDDNYGYIQRLNNETEKSRSGGAGVYYHASYWGRPHDYLWLSSTHPSLIREEMMKAYHAGARRLWMMNVGDIKPLEYNTQLFFDMAYNTTPFQKSDYTRKHLLRWTELICGPADAGAITETLWKYYTLAFERRPEFMGWSQTEPSTKTTYTAYNHFYFGDEAQRRIDQYDSLQKTVIALRNNRKGEEADAFYQLVYYPVVCAAWMNRKFLYRDKAFLYARQNRISCYDYAALSKAAYDSIVTETHYFNETLQHGKWKGMMSMQPRDLPVYQSPELPLIRLQKGNGWDAVPEGYDTTAFYHKTEKKLPGFTAGVQQQYFIDIFLSDSIGIPWNAKPSADWIILSKNAGSLEPTSNKNSQRIWINIDRVKLPLSELANGVIEISGAGKKINISVQAVQPAFPSFSTYRGFVETNGYVSIQAQHFTEKKGAAGLEWILMKDVGHTNAALTAVGSSSMPPPDTTNPEHHAAYVAYDFYSFSTALPNITIYTLPTFPLNRNFSMRYGIRIDDGSIKITDFKTVGRSEEWKQNVLRNSAIRTITFPSLHAGRHTLKIYAIDPGVILDRIQINFSNRQKNYSTIPETKVD